jgi:hypothetical protein
VMLRRNRIRKDSRALQKTILATRIRLA